MHAFYQQQLHIASNGVARQPFRSVAVSVLFAGIMVVHQSLLVSCCIWAMHCQAVLPESDQLPGNHCGRGDQ